MRTFLAAALALVTWSGSADACSCKDNSFPFASGSVPRNARLPVLAARGTLSPELRTMDGDLVTADLVSTTPVSFAIVPQALLTAGASYRLLMSTVELATFSVTASEDTEAPPAPTLDGFTRRDSPLIGGSNCELGGEDFFVNVTTPASELVVLEVFTGPSVASIDVSTPSVVVALGPSNQFGLGDGILCTRNFPVSTTESLAVQVRAVDLAGNRSELSNALQLKTVGCSATGGSALAMLAALLISRRRR